MRPISGYDSVEVNARGKNLCPYGSQTFTGVYFESFGEFIPAGTYTFSAIVTSEDADYTISLVYFSNTIEQKPIITGYISRGARGSVTVTIDEPFDAVYLYSSVGFPQSTDKIATFADIQLELGSTPTPYEPYQPGTTHTLALPSTVYGGELDAATGAGVETWRYVELDGTESCSLGNIDVSDTIQQFNLTIIDPKSDGGLPCVCNILPQTRAVISGNALGVFHYSKEQFVLGFPRAPLREYGFVDGNTETYITAFRAYLTAQYAAGTPVTIAYKLATPTPFTATGNASIPALPGVNTVYSDADSVTVTGRADPIHTIQALSDRVAALENAAVTNDTGGIQ